VDYSTVGATLQVSTKNSITSDFVPGGKLIASYASRAKSFTVCIWDAPSAEAFFPLLEQIALAGWDTEIMPAEKMTVYIEKLATALKAMKK
jgi:hypothetical protein